MQNCTSPVTFPATSAQKGKTVQETIAGTPQTHWPCAGSHGLGFLDLIPTVTRHFCLCLTLVILTLGATASALAQIQTATVMGGKLEGVVTNGVAAFKGIPFAAPPLHDLRWQAPQPVVPWVGTRKADAFGPSPMQDAAWALIMGSSASISEDCLYLNVWTPAKSPAEKRPVMVWIYGGGFNSGMTSAGLYDGTKLAQKGVVLVSIAYRVGPFGFLATPELSRESGHGSGNYGLLDQVAALQWVQQNIRQFGGDPTRVTIFGESAGGESVSMLTAVPAAKGLFQRVISESGGSMSPLKTGDEIDRMVPTLKLAEANGRKFLEKLGARDLKAARALSAETIQASGIDMGEFWPVADGTVLPGDEYELYLKGQYHDTPVLIGSNSDEGALFVHESFTPESFEQQVRNHFGPDAPTMLRLYPHATDKEAFKSAKDLFRESVFAWPTWAWATLHARHSRYPTFIYYFDHRIPGSPDGSNHATEIGYVFGKLDSWGGGSRPEDRALADLMSAYWVNFAATGNPNGPGLPVWPVFNEKNLNTMVFDQAPGVRPTPNLERLKAFDDYFARQRKQVQPAGL